MLCFWGSECGALMGRREWRDLQGVQVGGRVGRWAP